MFIAASDIMFRCVFDGCISVDNMEIERRPYHRNCSCALHKMEGGSSTGFPLPRNMFYPKKQSWRRCSLSLATPSILLAYQLKKRLKKLWYSISIFLLNSQPLSHCITKSTPIFSAPYWEEDPISILTMSNEVQVIARVLLWAACSTLLVQSGLAQLPLLPKIPGLPDITLPPIPGLPLLPGLPQIPGLPKIPLPPIPGLPLIPGLPQIPGLPLLPPLPQIPGLPSIPGLTSVPGPPPRSQIPGGPPRSQIPGRPLLPGPPQVPGLPPPPPPPQIPGVPTPGTPVGIANAGHQ
ncbi:hypothetical protein POPTR_018G113901v4 [Populus trichocarpa]|uniref:Uncharacterized protein n=1 Tax=Populus trichocarpa TaxID=3694 RepID=A0ACC0RN96_POPTR|nr:hypothetical protein POPTR_018G113901v4 [Populus trichocarpa]